MGMDFVDLSRNKAAAEIQSVLIKYAGVRGSVSIWKGSVRCLFFKSVKFPFYYITILFHTFAARCFYIFLVTNI